MSDRTPSGIGRGRRVGFMANPATESDYRGGSSDKTDGVLPKQAGRGQLLHSVFKAVCFMIYQFSNC